MSLLSKRYIDNGDALLSLNQLQVSMKNQIERKIRDGIYKFEDLPCPLCHKGNFSALSQKDRYGLHMPVVICHDCGLVQTNPRMTEDSYRSFYNAEYRKLYVGKETASNEFFDEQYKVGKTQFEFLKSANVLPSALNNFFVLEIGCGAGGILKYFKDQGCDVIGLDWGEDYIAFGREKHGMNIFVGGLADYKLDRKPDLIIYSHVFEHILDLPTELQLLSSVCGENTAVYIEVPGIKNLLNSYERDFLRYLQNAHVYHFSLTTLKNVLGTQGFNMIEGNEIIRSVFRKSSNAGTVCNDYEAALMFLKRMTYMRVLHEYTRFGWKSIPKVIIGKTLKRLHLR